MFKGAPLLLYPDRIGYSLFPAKCPAFTPSSSFLPVTNVCLVCLCMCGCMCGQPRGERRRRSSGGTTTGGCSRRPRCCRPSIRSPEWCSSEPRTRKSTGKSSRVVVCSVFAMPCHAMPSIAFLVGATLLSWRRFQHCEGFIVSSVDSPFFLWC